jgi:aminobenzoyl-glutamate utilization protein A
MSESYESFIQSITPYLIQKRREIHEHPEVGWTEYVTTYKLAKELEAMGYKLTVGKDMMVSSARLGVPSEQELLKNEERAKKMGVPTDFLEKMKGGHTGVIAQFLTGRPGKHVAMRFDIDALPIQESRDLEHRPTQYHFSSKRDGVMHACGHDGHAAIGLGVARFLQHFKDGLTGQFTLIFQPAEEGGRGAKPIVERGWLDHVDYFLSGHIGVHSLPVGTVAATTNKFLASSKYNIILKGKSAHAGLEPNAGKNALLAAAAASLHLNGIPRHADGATRINIGKLEAGSGRNIVPDYARMEIETRGETTALNEYMTEEALRIIKASAALYDVQVEIEFVGTALNATCDEVFIPIVEKISQQSSLIEKVFPVLPIGASEDVTYMMNHVQKHGGKATFMIFASPLRAGHHHPQFDYDEMVIPTAVETLSRTVLEMIKKEGTVHA